MGKKFQKSDQPTIEREKKNIFIMKTKIKKGKELVVHFVATKTGQKIMLLAIKIKTFQTGGAKEVYLYDK